MDHNSSQLQTCRICGKTCKILGNHLIKHRISAKDYYDTYLRKFNEGKCKVCGKDTKFKTISIGYIGKYCSPECMYSDKEHFNTKLWKETRQNKIDKFEKDNDCVFANTLRKKYGNGWYQANIVDFIYMDSQTKFVPANQINKIIEYNAKPHRQPSMQEKIIVQEIESIYDGTILCNIKGIISNSLELDIYLPDLNLAIEFNGLRYHSIEMGKPKDRILKKSILSRDKNIRLIHIYEFENIDKQIYLLKQLILGNDLYNHMDFNKYNLSNNTPVPTIIYKNKYTVYGAGPLL